MQNANGPDYGSPTVLCSAQCSARTEALWPQCLAMCTKPSPRWGGCCVQPVAPRPGYRVASLTLCGNRVWSGPQDNLLRNQLKGPRPVCRRSRVEGLRLGRARLWFTTRIAQNGSVLSLHACRVLGHCQCGGSYPYEGLLQVGHYRDCHDACGPGQEVRFPSCGGQSSGVPSPLMIPASSGLQNLHKLHIIGRLQMLACRGSKSVFRH